MADGFFLLINESGWMRMNNKRHSISMTLLPYIFLSPAIVLMAVFLFYPILNVFYYSLQSYNVNKPWDNHFAGLDNFIFIFSKDRYFYSSLLVSAKWVVCEVLSQLAVGLVLALILNRTFRLRGLVRATVFIPWAISGVLTSMMWSLLYNQQIGAINGLLEALHIIKAPVAWVANIHTGFAAVVIAELWRGIPFFVIMILAGLQTIPVELYEACVVDGGTSIDKFKYVMVPYLKNSVVLATLLRTVWEFKDVDLIYNLTGGGPVNKTMTLAMYLANTAIRDNDFGYGSALAAVMFILLLLFALFYLKISKFGDENI